MQIIPYFLEHKKKYSGWRQTIHSYPELAFQEVATSDFVAEKLNEFGLTVARGIGKTGLVATLKNGSSKRAIGIRADMDALPIQELNDFAHKSKRPGVMHACGHDGHTVMLLAAAEYLASNLFFDGVIHFIFQPAEEGEAGARAMMDDGLFENFPVESVYAVHNWPGLDVGKMAMRSGPAMAAFDTFKAEIKGKGGHAALPHVASDTIQVAAQIVLAWQTIVSRNIKPTEPAVLSVTRMHGGEAWAVIPKSVELGGTVRTFSEQVQILVEERMKKIAGDICDANDCEFSWHYQKRYPATVNSDKETKIALSAAQDVCGMEFVDPSTDMVTGSEDFGFMLQEKPGCYAFIGNGPGEGGCMLHSPTFDFNDDVTPIGATYWVNIVKKVLSSSP